jgi:thiopeptide-type bacteriocin biosynthesis protein
MEKVTNNDRWISSHLFYTNLNYLLKYSVHPLVIELRKKKLINQYFFIRYWEKGSHIRLRLLVSEKNIAEVEDFLNSYFNNFFKLNPSIRQNKSDNLFPNNSIHFIEYIPEIERYGGEYAIRVAEKHFQDSSEIVLNLIETYDNWNITISQGKALQLYVIFFRAISLSKDEIFNMLKIMNNSHWKTAAQKIVGSDNIDEIFTKQYLKNERSIKDNIKSLNEIIDTKEILNYPSFNLFYENIKEMDNTLSSLGKKKLLSSRNKIDYNTNTKKSFIYISYLHMLNNRLGLKNQDEAYLSFLIKKGMEF